MDRKIAFDIRRDYIRFIAEFPNKIIHNGKNLKEYFKMSGENISLWWLSSIAEKNPLKSDTYFKLLQNLDGKNIKKSSESTAFISNFTHTLAHTSKFLLKYFLVKFYMRNNTKKLNITGNKYLIVTYFPLVDKVELKHKRYLNRYYQPLQKAIQNKYSQQYSWILMAMKFENYSYREAYKLGKKISSWGEPVSFLEEWIGIKDLIKIFFSFFWINIKFLCKISFISEQFNFKDVNMWELSRKEWYSSFAGWTLLEGMIYYRAYKNLVSHLDSDIAIIYLAEMHPWEKALNAVANERKIRTIGIQHSNVSLLLLNYFNHKIEMADMPRPDYIACVGEIAKSFFIESGWEKNRVIVLGTMRHGHLKETLKSQIPWNTRENKVVVALSIDPKESKEVLNFVYQAYKGQTKYKVLIKGHPLLKVPPMVDALGLKLDPETFQIVDTPLGELLSKAKVMIGVEGSPSLEGIANQCPVIIPNLRNALDLNPLSYITDLPIYGGGPEDLRKITKEIMCNGKSPIKYIECKKFIESYFNFPENDEDFLKNLEKLT
jgi:surface carbohydrate biosynthesis protein (TIGR04326 family)